MSAAEDISYGPIAPGQFFIDRMNIRPRIYKTTGLLVEGVFWCDVWGMNEKGGVWSFGLKDMERGFQVASCNLERMERVSALEARLIAEQYLRSCDDDWRKQWAPNNSPIEIVRCTCGIGDDSSQTRHAVGCFYRL